MIKNLLNLLFPEICNGCDNPLLTNEKTLCSSCRHEIPFTNHCLSKHNETYKKFYGRLPLEHASSIVYYHKKGIVQELIHKLKYKGKQEVGTFFGELYATDLAQIHSLKKFDEIIPVPLHQRRLRKRGYNQITAFCNALSAATGVPLNEGLLERKSYSNTQTKKNLFRRTEIHKTLFETKFSKKDHGKHFLLIDDVITSGATLEACGKALLEIPNTKLSIITIAYTHS